MTGPCWDENAGGHPSRHLDRGAWEEELARLAPPPSWMSPQGRRSAEQAADRLRYALLLIALALVVGASMWSLGALR